VSLFGERACLAMPAMWSNPGDDKSATPCEHGSIGENGADIVCGTNWVETAPGRNRGAPSRLALMEKILSYSQAVTTPRSRVASSTRLLPSHARNRHGLSPNRMARKWPTAY
jgi:hypothetical protein